MNGRARKGIGAVIFGVSGMSGHPFPKDFVARCSGVELLPEIGVLHRFLVGRFPSVCLPAWQPQGDSIQDVARIGVQRDVGGLSQRFESADGGVRLFVNPRCKELIKDLEQVVYLPDTTMIDKLRDPRRTHLSDALGYLLWQECRPRTDVGEKRGRLF